METPRSPCHSDRREGSAVFPLAGDTAREHCRSLHFGRDDKGEGGAPRRHWLMGPRLPMPTDGSLRRTARARLQLRSRTSPGAPWSCAVPPPLTCRQASCLLDLRFLFFSGVRHGLVFGCVVELSQKLVRRGILFLPENCPSDRVAERDRLLVIQLTADAGRSCSPVLRGVARS
jgi:hypothetical protein